MKNRSLYILQYVSRIIKQDNNIWADGTFKICPPRLTPLCTIYVHIFYTSFLLFMYSWKRKIANLIRIFYIKWKHMFNLNYFVIDGEHLWIFKDKIVIGIEIFTCTFHFGQSLWRKFLEFGIYRKFKCKWVTELHLIWYFLSCMFSFATSKANIKKYKLHFSEQNRRHF